MFFNNLAFPISALVGILVVPVMLKMLGQDSYGLWIVATSMSGIVAAFDFGLYWSVCRVVASDTNGRERENAEFVNSAGNVYVLLGIAGCVILGGAGLFSESLLHLPPVQRDSGIIVFWLVGAAFCADRIHAFGCAVLAGTRRFRLINTVTVITAIAWGVCVVAALANGCTVAMIAALHLVVTVVKSVLTLYLVARFSPGYRFRPGFLMWSALRRHAQFALSSLLIDLFGNITWNSAPLLIGLMIGSAPSVPYHIGQKLPLAVSAMSWKAAEVMFPAASESRDDLARSRNLLWFGSRWILALVLPASALLFVAAPNLLHAWLGTPPPGSVTILRILSVTLLADAISVAPLHLLWGRGAIRAIAVIYVALGTAVVVLSVIFIGSFGAVGAAWGLLVPLAVSAAAVLAVTSHTLSMDLWKHAAHMWRGLALPTALCVICALLVIHAGGDNRFWAFGGCLLGSLLYAAILFVGNGSMEERQVARDMRHHLKSVLKEYYRRFRSTVGRVACINSAYNLFVALYEYIRDPWREPACFEKHFTTPDPWKYETGEGRERLLKAASLMQSVQQGRFRNALEIGCAEGAFTEMLAPCCESLVAVDFAPHALERTRQRLRGSHVTFQQLDLRRDPLPGTFDLIIVMDVLDCIFRPAILRRVRNRLVDAMEPGGYLLLVDPRQNASFESSWWGRLLIRGGTNVRAFVACHVSLRLVSEDSTETHVFGLFRKIPS